MTGYFITFEGPDGSGKTTQIKLLANTLVQKGFAVELTREPGGTPGAEEIRHLVLQGEKGRWDVLTELLLFSAARRDHLVRKIWPALQEGKIVLCDRFADATMAYQGMGYGRPEMTAACAQIYRLIAGDFQPHLTIMLDLPIEQGLARSLRPHNHEVRFESMDKTFHQNLRQGYLDIAKNNPNRCVVVAADRTVAAIACDIQDIVLKHLEAL